MMRHTVLIGLLVAFTFAADARTVDVTIQSVSPQQALDTDKGTLVISAVAVQDPNKATRRLAISVPGTTTIDLPDGVWRLQITAAGWFNPGSIVTVSKSDIAAVIPIWPLGILQGKIETSDNSAADDMTVRWSAPSKEPVAPPEGELRCTVNEKEYRCSVPSGVLDVKIGVRGYGSQFLWGVKITPRDPATVPLIHFKKGAGAYGWVAVGKDVAFDPVATTVRLTSTSLTEHSSKRQRTIVTKVDRRGFFMFTGVDPGAYRISATVADANSESEERELTIRPGREAELLRPLVLELKVPLRVTITPPTGPSGERWHLVVTRIQDAYGNRIVMNQGDADATGVATIPNLPAGPYQVSVAPKHKDIGFVTRAVEMPRDAALAIEIQTTHVVGSVRMSGRPLAGATVWVGGRFRTPAVTLTTDIDGEFSGDVPFAPDETWLVTVTNSTPSITKTFNQQPDLDNDKTVRLNLVIPGGMIAGDVVEADGVPTLRGIANVIRAGDATSDVIQTPIADGKFELGGLTSGEYTVYAEGLGGRTTRKANVNVEEDEESSIKLTFGGNLTFTGRLTGDDGMPIAGAKVFVNSVEVPAPVWIPRATSDGGEFVTELPEGTHTVDVIVIAPGFALKAFRAPVETERQLVVLMRQNGGRLGLTFPAVAMEGVAGRIPYVIHNGVVIPAMFLLSNRVATSSASEAAFSITAPHVEPGAYGLCVATFAEATSLSQSDNCSFGNLPPFGAVDLWSRTTDE
jgi:hypothetical protein